MKNWKWLHYRSCAGDESIVEASGQIWADGVHNYKGIKSVGTNLH